jgi:hypothetical protein
MEVLMEWLVIATAGMAVAEIIVFALLLRRQNRRHRDSLARIDAKWNAREREDGRQAGERFRTVTRNVLGYDPWEGCE